MKIGIPAFFVFAVIGASTVFARQTRASQPTITDNDFATALTGVSDTLKHGLQQTEVKLAHSAAAVLNPDEGEAGYSSFDPWKITMYRDGGTIVIEGHLNRSFAATIRLDRRINSPTHGLFFVTEKLFYRPAEPERKMTLSELKGLHRALKRYMNADPRITAIERDSYEQLITQAESVIKSRTEQRQQ